MKATLSWLKEFVDIALTPRQLAEALTMAGLEVEGYERIERRFSGVVAGRVLSCTPHPSASSLTVCQVDSGGHGLHQVVCGAPNVRPSLFAPLALVGAQLADGSIVQQRQVQAKPGERLLVNTRKGRKSLCGERCFT